MDHNKAFEFTEKLSIIIPAYNEEEGIESTIRELLDYEPLSGAEIIVVNDGSKDETYKKLKLFQGKITIVNHRTNRGYGSALVSGVKKSERELVAWYDADGQHRPCDLEKVVRTLYENIKGTVPYCVKRVAVLNCWGKMRAWGNHMVHHAIYYKQNYSYAGIIEALSGAPFDVSYISFDDIRENPGILDEIDVILNVGDAYTAYSGGENWKDEQILTAVKKFVWRGGGFIGVGEPAAYQWEGRFFQLSGVMGVEEETGFTLNVDKYNWDEHAHFITEDCEGEIDFGEGKKNIFALEDTVVLRQIDQGVQLAVHEFGQGRSVYISGLPYSFENSRLLYRSILWAAGSEDELLCWFSSNVNVEVHAYIRNGKYCVVNNTYEPQQTTVYKGDGTSFTRDLKENEIVWYTI